MVSVLMPVRDAAGTLSSALRSIVTQTLRDMEIVVVDDGSRDDSRNRLLGWAARDERIRLITGPGGGLISALEAGRKVARGQWIARMDADDLAHPDRLRLQVEHLKAHPELAGTGCRVRLFPRDRLRAGWLRYERWINALTTAEQIRRERFVESPLVHPTVMVRADVLEETGGYRDRGWPEDADLWLRLLAAGHGIDKVARTLLLWRETPGRHSRTHPRYHPERFRQMKLAHLLSGPLTAHRKVILWGAGKNGRRWARLLLSAGVEPIAFIDVDPAKVGRILHGIPVRPFAWLAEQPPQRRVFMLGAVAAAGARQQIREALLGLAMEEERDFLFVQ